MLILIIGGIVDFGFAFNAQITATHAAREGVRAAALSSGNPVTVATTAFNAPATSAPTFPTVTACPNAAGRARVRLQSTYTFVILPGSRTVTGDAVMRCNG
ncbi:TadE family protein [Egicoccus halophilus]|uniref:TadE/TadG family type IV pilus assembly protein n=1 Tax=Egicoccus halophilus TaxID=1670830 RepID=UPI001F0D9664